MVLHTLTEKKTKMTTKQLRRVKILITELEKLRATTKTPKFNMGQWMSRLLKRRNSKKAMKIAIMEATREPCNTSACLAGKAGLIPKIRRMGFRWDVIGANSYGEGVADFRYKDFIGDEAVKQFFGYDTYSDVFLNTYDINTLFQGINALKRAVKAEENERVYE